MLSNRHFFFRLTRKYVSLFGSLFNNVTLVKYKDDGTEISRSKVPIQYGPKERWVSRAATDENLDKPVQVNLPRMSFEIKRRGLDKTRKQQTLIKTVAANTNSRLASQFIGVPYNLDFELSIYVRNVDDGDQIIEQILPYFTPDLTPEVRLVVDVGITKDIPVILNGVDETIDYEGDGSKVRMITWTLSFTMQAYYFGHIASQGIIRKVITNIYNDPTLNAGYITVANLVTGNGSFKLDDMIYQGATEGTATAIGVVTKWDANTGKLYISGTQGQFRVNTVIRAASTNANWNLHSFSVTPTKLVTITIDPDPLTADPDDDYGYTETITEFPDTL